MSIGNGEVVDGGAGDGPAFDRGDLDVGAGAGLQPLAGLQVGGVDPLPEFWRPEGVAVGGGDFGGVVAVLAVGVDGDLHQVLDTVTRDDCGNRFHPGLAGFRVGGDDSVARPDVLDRLARTISHEDLGATKLLPAVGHGPPPPPVRLAGTAAAAAA